MIFETINKEKGADLLGEYAEHLTANRKEKRCPSGEGTQRARQAVQPGRAQNKSHPLDS